jgi:hypothetical protein
MHRLAHAHAAVAPMRLSCTQIGAQITKIVRLYATKAAGALVESGSQQRTQKYTGLFNALELLRSTLLADTAGTQAAQFMCASLPRRDRQHRRSHSASSFPLPTAQCRMVACSPTTPKRLPAAVRAGCHARSLACIGAIAVGMGWPSRASLVACRSASARLRSALRSARSDFARELPPAQRARSDRRARRRRGARRGRADSAVVRSDR